MLSSCLLNHKTFPSFLSVMITQFFAIIVLNPVTVLTSCLFSQSYLLWPYCSKKQDPFC